MTMSRAVLRAERKLRSGEHGKVYIKQGSAQLHLSEATVKSLMPFLQCLLDDLSRLCCTSTSRDLKTITARVEHEGMSFLTISLPNFCSDFQKSLDQGFVGDDQFPGFARTGGLPRFLSGFLRHVFDSESGTLLNEPSIVHIHAIRQITLMFAKINLPCTPAREASAIRSYVECEQDVRKADKRLLDDPDRIRRFDRMSRLLWADLLSSVDRKVYEEGGRAIIPKHGPGATADRLRGNSKWEQAEWTERLEQVFPHGIHLAPSWRYFQDLSHVRILEPGAERPVRVITVPKTLKSPRIIAVEPTCMQYMQQGLLDAFRNAVEADDIASGVVGWATQVPNKHLASKGSEDGTLATLDLSEASDRVSNQHVRALLRTHPHASGAVDSCRSRKADVPGHGVIRLAKFASMGSALTFPLEAMVFATIIFVAIERELNASLSRRALKSYVGKVRVYGDDIIVPVEFVHAVIAELEAFGLKVNASKSFWSGKFRESCGGDYYAGHDVSVVRMRSIFPTRRTDVQEIVSTLEFRNHLYKSGLWGSARYLDEELGRLIPLPVVLESSPVLGRHSFLGYETQRSCPELFRPLVKGWTLQPRIPSSRLEDVGALLKCLVLMERGNASSSLTETSEHNAEKRGAHWIRSLPGSDDEHLERSGRPQRVDTKLRWATPY